MPAFIKTKQDERRWSKAKDIVRSQYPKLKESDDSFWKLTTSIYKKININRVTKEASEHYEEDRMDLINYFRLKKLATVQQVIKAPTPTLSGFFGNPQTRTSGSPSIGGLGLPTFSGTIPTTAQTGIRNVPNPVTATGQTLSEMGNSINGGSPNGLSAVGNITQTLGGLPSVMKTASDDSSGGVGRFATGAITGTAAAPVLGTVGGVAGYGIGSGLTALVNILRIRRGKAPLNVETGGVVGMTAGGGLSGLTGLVGGYKFGGKLYDALDRD